MDAKQQIIVVKDGGWGPQQKQHQIDEPQDKDHGQLPDATDVQEDRAGQQTQQHVPDEVLEATAEAVLGEGRSQGAQLSPARPKPLHILKPGPLSPSSHPLQHTSAPGAPRVGDSGEILGP